MAIQGAMQDPPVIAMEVATTDITDITVDTEAATTVVTTEEGEVIVEATAEVVIVGAEAEAEAEAVAVAEMAAAEEEDVKQFLKFPP